MFKSKPYVFLRINFVSILKEPCCAYTLQRASWLLPIVDSANDDEEEVDYFDGMCINSLVEVNQAIIT